MTEFLSVSNIFQGFQSVQNTIYQTVKYQDNRASNEDIDTLRKEIQRLQISLADERSLRMRLEHELHRVYEDNGSDAVIEQLRKENHTLRISKLLLIESTANEINHLREIIHKLSRGEVPSMEKREHTNFISQLYKYQYDAVEASNYNDSYINSSNNNNNSSNNNNNNNNTSNNSQNEIVLSNDSGFGTPLPTRRGGENIYTQTSDSYLTANINRIRENIDSRNIQIVKDVIQNNENFETIENAPQFHIGPRTLTKEEEKRLSIYNPSDIQSYDIMIDDNMEEKAIELPYNVNHNFEFNQPRTLAVSEYKNNLAAAAAAAQQQAALAQNINNNNNNNNRNNNNNNMNSNDVNVINRGINNSNNNMNRSKDDDNGNNNRNEIDDNVNGGNDELLYARDNKGRIIQTDDGSNNAFKQGEYQETVDMDKMDQNLLDSANGIPGIPEFNNNALLSSEDQDDDNLNKIINSVTGVRNNNMYINNSNQEEDISDIMGNNGTQNNKQGNNPPALSDILHRSNTYILGPNEAKDIQRTALDGVREYENESDNESKTVVSDADTHNTQNTHKTHETRESRGSVSETVVQNDGPIPSPAPTNTASLTGRGYTPSLNEGITPMPGVPNDLYGDSDEENSFGAVGPMHYARQRSGGIQLHNQSLSMISINSSASKRGGGAHKKSNTLVSLSPRKGLMISNIERTNKLFETLCTISLLPYGMEEFRTEQMDRLDAKIFKHLSLKQELIFFLNAFRNCDHVRRLWKDHAAMVDFVRDTKLLSKLITRYHHSKKRSKTFSSPRTNYDAELSVSAMTQYNSSPNLNPNLLGSPSVPMGMGVGDVVMPIDEEKTDFSFALDDSDMENNDEYNFIDFGNGSLVDYEGLNPVEFFRMPFIKPMVGLIVRATNSNAFVDPLNPGNKNVRQLKVVKIFGSNAKPMVIECYRGLKKNEKAPFNAKKGNNNSGNNNGNGNGLSLVDEDSDGEDERINPVPCSSFILKYGDDLRKDWAVIQMFNIMNQIWGRNSVQYAGILIQALTYKVIPMGPQYGIIELIPDCLPLKEYCEQKEKLSAKALATLRATCAGSFMAAYVMGIRDRHYDNVLIAKDGTCFHIDFGYMLGEKVAGIDTSKIAITSDLKKLLGNDADYRNFVDMATLAWSVLRANYEEILDYARLVFAYLYPQEEVESFLRRMLRIDEDTLEAQKYVRKKLNDAPKAVKTKMKNFFHGLAGKTPKGFKRKVSM